MDRGAAKYATTGTSGADLPFAILLTAYPKGERQIQSSTGMNIFQWSFDPNIRKGGSFNGMRMLGSDHWQGRDRLMGDRGFGESEC
jgi:hypothetical protein